VLIAIALVIGGAWTIFLFLTQRPDLICERERFALGARQGPVPRLRPRTSTGPHYVAFRAPLSQADFTDHRSIANDAAKWWGATTVDVRKGGAKLSRND